MDCQDTDAKWYVLRVTYQRELSTKEYLDKLHVENFVPVRVVRRRDSKGRFSRVREAAVHNYIFVRSTREVIDDLKTFRLPILRYVMHQQNGENQIMTVPESQMRNFYCRGRQYRRTGDFPFARRGRVVERRQGED